MLNNVKHEIGPYGSGYSNWSLLLLEIKSPMHEVSIVGKNVDEIKGRSANTIFQTPSLLKVKIIPIIYFLKTGTLKTKHLFMFVKITRATWQLNL